MKKALIVFGILILLGVGFGIGTVTASSNSNGDYESRISALEYKVNVVNQALESHGIHTYFVPTCEPYPWSK